MAAGGSRVVITGVSSHWGTELARALERDPSISYLAGVDTREPKADLEQTEFIEADIRNPVISRILPGLEPDVVVHCGIVWYPEPDKPARALFWAVTACVPSWRAARRRSTAARGRRRRSSPRTWHAATR